MVWLCNQTRQAHDPQFFKCFIIAHNSAYGCRNLKERIFGNTQWMIFLYCIYNHINLASDRIKSHNFGLFRDNFFYITNAGRRYVPNCQNMYEPVCCRNLRQRRSLFQKPVLRWIFSHMLQHMTVASTKIFYIANILSNLKIVFIL